jgi:hypothetical protein
VTVLKSDAMTNGPARQVAQLLQIEYPHGGSTATLRQIRILDAFRSLEDQSAAAVIQLVMTCPAELFEQAGPEFGRFMASLAPAGDQISTAADASTVDRQRGRSGA